MKQIRKWSVAGIIAIAVAVGCGEEEPVEQIECGEGTELYEGACVPEDHDCPEGEMLSPDGLCEDPDDFVCDEGTSYDRAEDRCISEAKVVCGEGTIEVDGQCVIEDPKTCGDGAVLFEEECVASDEVCGDGTSFDDDDVECRPDDGACSEGTEFDVGTGECVDLNIVECGEDTVESDDQCLAADTFADQLAADADIDYSDAAPIVPDDDEEFVFTGSLDDDLSQTFELQAEEGQWIEVSLYSRGLPSPGFSMTKSFGDWERAVPPATASVPTRQMLIPEDEDYDLTIRTTLTDHEDWDEGGQDGWDYVGTVEVLDPPASVDWDAFNEIYLGDLKQPMDNFIEVDTEDTFDLLIGAEAIGEDAHGSTLEVWTDTDEYLERHELTEGPEASIDVSDYDSVYLHVDAVEFSGSLADIELGARSTELLGPGDFYVAEVEAEAGETVIMTHESDEAARVDVDVRLDGLQQYIFIDAPAYNDSDIDEDENMRQFFYVQEDGTYTVEFRNNSFDDISRFVGSAYTEDVPVFEVPDDGSEASFSADVEADSLEEGDWRFVAIDTPDRALLDVTIEAGDGNPRGSIYSDTPRDRVANTSGSSGTADLDLYEAEEAGIYYAVSRPWSSVTYVSDLVFNIDGRVIDELEPDDVVEQTFNVDSLDVYTGTAGFELGDEAEVRMLNQFGDIVFEEELDGEINLIDTFPGTGEYTFQVENTGSETIRGSILNVTHHQTFDWFTIVEDLSESYERPSLEAGQSEALVFEAPDDERIVGADVEFGSGVDGEMRLWDLTTSQLVGESSGTNEFSMGGQIQDSRQYALEVKAVSAADDGYELNLDDTDIKTVVESVDFSPPTVVEAGAEVEFPVTVSDCSSVIDVSVETDIPDTFSNSLSVDLHVPGLSSPIRLRDESGPDSSTYPDETEPAESMSPIIGASGNGDWALEIINDAFTIDTELAGWTLTLTCPE